MPIKNILRFLPIAYLIYSLVVLWFVGRTLFQVYQAYSIEAMPAPPMPWLQMTLLAVFSGAFITMFVLLAIFLSARRHRRAALIIAGISCLGIPVGTILGGLTLYALTRPEIADEFA